MPSTQLRQKATFYKYASILCVAVAVIQLLTAFASGKVEYLYFGLALACLATYSARRARMLRKEDA